jgi:hypothetical protein
MRARPRSPLAAALLAAALVLSAATAAAATTVKEQERSLLKLLAAHEYQPNRRVLDRIGPDVNQLLVHVASYRNVRTTLRVRALASLALYPSPRTRQYLSAQLHERDLMGTPGGTLMRRQAMRSLGLAFGVEVVGELTPFRDDPDPQIREGAAHALGDTGAADALAPLSAWLPNESKLFVRVAIDNAINRIRAAKRRAP